MFIVVVSISSISCILVLITYAFILNYMLQCFYFLFSFGLFWIIIHLKIIIFPLISLNILFLTVIWLFNGCFSDFWCFDWILSGGKKILVTFPSWENVWTFSLSEYMNMWSIWTREEIKAKCKNVKRLKLFMWFMLWLLPPGSAWRRGPHINVALFIAHLALLKTTFHVNMCSCQHINTCSATLSHTGVEETTTWWPM